MGLAMKRHAYLVIKVRSPIPIAHIISITGVEPVSNAGLEAVFGPEASDMTCTAGIAELGKANNIMSGVGGIDTIVVGKNNMTSIEGTNTVSVVQVGIVKASNINKMSCNGLIWHTGDHPLWPKDMGTKQLGKRQDRRRKDMGRQWQETRVSRSGCGSCAHHVTPQVTLYCGHLNAVPPTTASPPTYSGHVQQPFLTPDFDTSRWICHASPAVNVGRCASLFMG